MLGGTDNPIGIGNWGTDVAVSVMAHTGLSNYQALQAFTTAPAKLMGLLDQVGTIQPGMIADMDIIHGNPIENIEMIANDDYVARHGLPGNVAAEAASIQEILTLVATGRGVSLVPASVADHYPRADVTYRPVTDADPAVVSLAWRPGAVRPSVEAFLDTARQLAG